ncbi:MAG: CAP domain-containing protein, partial [Chitinophagaceae bacterium]
MNLTKRYAFLLTLSVGMILLLSSFAILAPSGIGEDVLTYTNRFRKSKGLVELSSNKILDAVAQKHSEDMAAGRVKFGHDGFAKRNAAVQQKLSIRYFAENVAFGASTGEDV